MQHQNEREMTNEESEHGQLASTDVAVRPLLPPDQRYAPNQDTPTSALEQTRFILKFLANLGDGSITVPGLKAAAQIALQIIDVAQQVQDNGDDCDYIIGRIGQLMEAMIISLGGKSDADIDLRLKRDLENFGRDLEKVLKILRSLTKLKLSTRIIRNKENAQEILRCEKMLDHSFKMFQVYTMIWLQLGVTELRTGIIALKQLAIVPDISTEIENPKPCSVLPTAPEIFFGREDFIAAALDALQTVKPTRIAILGPGGIGKTATALTILQHEKVADIFQQNRFFVSCNAVTTTSMLVGGISAALGIEVTPRDNVLDVLYKKLSSKDSTLLVLDNFETPWEQLGNQAEVEHVLNTIAGIKTVSLIVTIRGSVYPSAAIRWTASQKLPPLLPLSPEAARSTFLALNQLSLTPQVEMDLATLLKELDHVPLAIKIIAQVGTGQSCRHLSKRWREKRTSLLHTRGPQSDHLTSVDVSIAISLQCLLVMENPEAIQLLSLICNLPDGVLMWEDQLASIAKALKSPDNAVSTLLKVSLAFVDAVGTLRVLSPIRYYVLEKHPADAAHVMGMEAFYTAIISRYGVDEQGSNLKIAREKLWPEQGNIQSILRHGLRDHPSEELAEAAYQMSLLLSRTQPSVALLELILPCLRLWDLTVREAECYFLMGEIFRLQSRFLEAQEMLMKSYEQFTAIGQPKKAAQCLHSLSITLRVQGKFAEAQIWVEQAEQEFMVIGEYLGASWCLQSLGDILRVQGRLSEAQGKMEQAQRQFGEMGESVGMAWSTQSLAEIFKADGRILEARSMLGRAQQQFAELSDALGGAWCLQCLGDILRVEKRFSEAQVMLAEAQKQFAGIGEPVGEARCIQTIGEALRGQGKLPEAQVMLKQAAQQFLDIGQHDAAVQCLTEQEYLSRL